MELQLLEVYIPNDKLEHFQKEIENFSILSQWRARISEQEQVFKLLIEKQHAEGVLNFLETEASYDTKTRALLYNISTYIPHIEEEEEEPSQEEKQAEITRASRHELYNVVNSSSHLTVNFKWMLVLSAIVATTGIVKDSAAVVIGAMVIAPLIGPFTSLAFSALLGDYKLMRRSVSTALFGIVVPLAIAAVFGFVFEIPLDSEEFLARTNVEMMDIILALAAGAAGALSFAKRVSEALVGVMVSVALLPPTIVLGMLVGAGEWQTILTPFLLLLVNVHAILLSAIIVFWLTGIKPVNWQEIQAANTSRKMALFFVAMVIIILGVVIYFISF
ncbi:putative hydrophobic protein (TIGR00341 family) [Natronobacillus azotifigens]|uniref:TIGR00341 family protein n=1 Tax=Natronobacillus azotifigens TaxID=472978 RepID=A0A9J6RF42_9BACI|nr:TIGR00341 family protein [Natronobacillus azotifigens]MCZ0703793.1 TIGR00341 family protein [Natronobacillus azotifigens]